jgi:hypothetical protein
VFAGFMYNWFGIKPPVETLKVKNIQVFIPKVSEYAPKDGSEAKEVFDGVKSVTGQISYMFTNIFSHITMGGRAGVLDATVGPELRETLEKSTNEVVKKLCEAAPASVEKFTKKK